MPFQYSRYVEQQLFICVALHVLEEKGVSVVWPQAPFYPTLHQYSAKFCSQILHITHICIPLHLFEHCGDRTALCSRRGPPVSCHLTRRTHLVGVRGEAVCSSYRVPLVPLVPRFEHQLPIAVPALVQTLQLVQVDPAVQSILDAPLGRLVLPLAPAVPVPVSVSVSRHHAAPRVSVAWAEIGG